MSAFLVEVADRPGALARLCEVLAAREVNLVVCAMVLGVQGMVAFVTDDEAAARDAMRDAEIDYAEGEALTVRLRNVPGAGAAAFGALAAAGVNLELVLPIRIYDDQFYAVICPGDVPAAVQALGELVESAPGS